MNKLCLFIGMTVLGWLGWWLGSLFSLTAAFVLSSIGSMAGVYAGWRIHREYFD